MIRRQQHRTLPRTEVRIGDVIYLQQSMRVVYGTVYAVTKDGSVAYISNNMDPLELPEAVTIIGFDSKPFE